MGNTSNYFTETDEDVSASIQNQGDFGQLTEEAQSREWAAVRWIVAGVVVATVAIIVAIKFTPGRSAPPVTAEPPLTISLVGRDAKQLSPGDPVILGNIRIGTVREVSTGLHPTAICLIDSLYSDQLTADHEFKVEATNRLLSGAVGVLVAAPHHPLPTSLPIHRGATIILKSGPLPAQIPASFYLVILGATSVFFLLAVAAWKLCKPLVLSTTIAAALLVAVFFFIKNNHADPILEFISSTVTETFRK